MSHPLQMTIVNDHWHCSSLCLPLYNVQCACRLTLVNKAVKVCNAQFIGALGTSNNELRSGVHGLHVTNKHSKCVKCVEQKAILSS